MILALALALALQASETRVSGVVHDASDAVVVGAAVTARTASGAEVQTRTGSDGRFTLIVPASWFEHEGE